MLATNKTIMIVTQRNQIFEYAAPSVEDALNTYIHDVLIAGNMFTISEDAWNILVETLPEESQQDRHHLSVRAELINGYCRRRKYKIAKIVTGHYAAYPDYVGTYNGVVYRIPDGSDYAEVIGYHGTSNTINIVNEFEGFPVVRIAAGAFKYVNLTSINIPRNITYIGANAFLGCAELKTIIYCNSIDNYDLIEIEQEGNDLFKNITADEHVATGDKCPLCSHTHIAGPSTIENIVQVTCDRNGSYDSVTRCSDCGAKISSTSIVTEAPGHDWVEATCAHPKLCNRFGLTDVDTLAHNYTSRTIDPTCVAKGFISYTCTECGHSYTEEIAALGHSYENASCDSAATCTVCGASTGAALGHDYRYAVNKSPTITTAGSLTGTCSRCKGTTTVSLPKLTTTNYVRTTTKVATCTTTGTYKWAWKTTTYGTFTFNTTMPATGHTYSQNGTGKCTVCGNACEHNYVDFSTIDPTCVDQGFKVQTCTKCGYDLVEPNAAALGHTLVLNSSRPETCTISGLYSYTCSRCGETETKVVPATGHVYTGNTYCAKCGVTCQHQWNSWTTVKKATCTEAGYKTASCNVSGCSGLKTETIPALGHYYGQNYQTPEGIPGDKYCQRCNALNPKYS
jgi:hypothetical protein